MKKKLGKAKRKSRCFTFTFNNYNPKDIGTLLTYFNDEKNRICYVFQEELSESGTPHLQGVIRFPNPVGIAFQSNLTERIHWEYCRSWKRSIKYCSKLDSRNGKVYTNIVDLKIPKPLIDLYDLSLETQWQRDILQLIDQPPDDRTINWYWENVGSVGKSRLTRHILLTHKFSALAVAGGNRDILHGITSFIKNELNEIKIIIIDVARSNFQNVSYKAIEAIKNGFFFSGKYESEMVIFNPPHVIVFCNFLPDLSKLSIDRWKVVNIPPSGSAQALPSKDALN